MEVVIRIYTIDSYTNYMDTRAITLNAGELDSVLSEYLEAEYCRDNERIESISYESVNL